MVKCQIFCHKKGRHSAKKLLFLRSEASVSIKNSYEILAISLIAWQSLSLRQRWGRELIVFWLDLEVSLWVSANRADFWSLLAYADVAAVGALPDAVAFA